MTIQTSRVLFFFFAIVIFFSCGPSEETIIKETFTEYQMALFEGNGTKAAEFLDQKTLAFYGKLGGMALEADSTRISRLSFYNKVIVLYLRQTMPKSQLIKGVTNPKKIYASSLQKEFIDYEGLANLELKIIKVREKTTGKEASVWMGDANTDEKFPVKFKYQDDRWKINFATILNTVNQAYRYQVYQEAEFTETELVFFLVEEVSGKPIRKDIWTPVKERE